MKRLAILIMSIIVVVMTTMWSVNIWRESKLLQISGLDLVRADVTLKEKRSQNINFGADERSAFLFRLPDDYDGLANCGTNGYSSVRSADVMEFDIDEALSCGKAVVSKDGTVYEFIIFSKQLYIKVLA